MKILISILIGLLVLGCEEKNSTGPQVETPESTTKKLIADPIVEKAIRRELKKPTGELTHRDFKKITELSLSYSLITDAGLKELAKLQQLRQLRLSNTKITDSGLG